MSDDPVDPVDPGDADDPVDSVDSVDAAVSAAVADVAARRPLLVGLDFDGVLAPIVEHPSDARPLPGSMAAVARIAAAPDVSVVLVSGRARADLRALSGVPEGDAVLLVGSHGAELPPPTGAGAAAEPPDPLDTEERERLAHVQARLEGLAAEYPGAHVEHKPTAAVLHTRRLARGDAETVTAQALALLASVPGVHVTRGKEVVEAAVTQASKGAALARLRDELGAAALLYLGDDVTDETVFRSLREGDLGIKVGDGDTAAAQRLPGPEAVRTLLRSLADEL